jgi:hypothetical protein
MAKPVSANNRESDENQKVHADQFRKLAKDFHREQLDADIGHYLTVRQRLSDQAGQAIIDAVEAGLLGTLYPLGLVELVVQARQLPNTGRLRSWGSFGGLAFHSDQTGSGERAHSRLFLQVVGLYAGHEVPSYDLMGNKIGTRFVPWEGGILPAFAPDDFPSLPDVLPPIGPQTLIEAISHGEDRLVPRWDKAQGRPVYSLLNAERVALVMGRCAKACEVLSDLVAGDGAVPPETSNRQLEDGNSSAGPKLKPYRDLSESKQSLIGAMAKLVRKNGIDSRQTAEALEREATLSPGAGSWPLSELVGEGWFTSKIGRNGGYLFTVAGAADAMSRFPGEK